MIKQLVEQGRIDSKVENKGVVDIGPVHVAGVRRSCAFDEIGPSMQQAMADAASRLAAAGIDTSGELVSVYHRLDIKRQRFDYTAGYVLDRPVSGSAEIDVWNLPRGRALRVDHTGDYHHLGNAWSAAQQFARYNKLKPCKQGAFELYKNDPRQSPPSEWLTEVYLPLR
jgi:effector-binding domain-containing protein